MLQSNKFVFIRKTKTSKNLFEVFLSNTARASDNHNKNCIAFISYDYKNEIENFKIKNNNPLRFPNFILAEVEKKIVENIFDTKPNYTKRKCINISPTISKEDYIKKVNALKQHIQKGDIYEINYCITFEAKNAEINPLEVFEKLNSISDAPYGCLAKFENNYIISSSPELFITKQKNKLITKPIKGTAKRGKTINEDDLLKKNLLNSLKERTENIMIVDVCRNDLSRIAEKGSVKAEKLYDIESYQQVHQMVSTVTCELKNQISFSQIIDATFPMASMTGAPKIKAMQLIDEYELYNRNAYSGTLGYIDEEGNFDLSVLIRSIFYDDEKKYLNFSVGSAITAMCNAEEEYEECLLKANAMIQVLSEL